MRSVAISGAKVFSSERLAAERLGLELTVSVEEELIRARLTPLTPKAKAAIKAAADGAEGIEAGCQRTGNDIDTLRDTIKAALDQARDVIK